MPSGDRFRHVDDYDSGCSCDYHKDKSKKKSKKGKKGKDCSSDSGSAPLPRGNPYQAYRFWG